MDDIITLLVSSSEDMKILLRKLKRERQNKGLMLNVKKAKILTMDKYDHDTFELDGDEIEVVKDFILLGTLVNSDAASKQEIKRRITMGKST